jgi:caffeoyl-CoA O-methyltransferase
MTEIVDAAIERYAAEHTSAPSSELADVESSTRDETPLPGMMTGRMEARLLEAFVVAAGAKRVLEVGTFTGHGALSIASRLDPGGRVITIEYDERLAGIARRNIEASAYAEMVELIQGDAHEIIETLDGPFDLVFVDAWKFDYLRYYEAVLPKLAPRGVLIADNVLWRGGVLDENATDRETRALREFNDHVQSDARVENVLLTVGDGLLVAWRRP